MTKFEKRFLLRTLKALKKYITGVDYKFLIFKNNMAIQIIQNNKSFLIEGIEFNKEYSFEVIMERLEKCLLD